MFFSGHNVPINSKCSGYLANIDQNKQDSQISLFDKEIVLEMLMVEIYKPWPTRNHSICDI